MNEWISVEKYNPPFEKDVLAVILHKPEIGTFDIQVCYLNDDGIWFLGHTYGDDREFVSIWSLGSIITHWMFLPEPPK